MLRNWQPRFAASFSSESLTIPIAAGKESSLYPLFQHNAHVVTDVFAYEAANFFLHRQLMPAVAKAINEL